MPLTKCQCQPELDSV